MSKDELNILNIYHERMLKAQESNELLLAQNRKLQAANAELRVIAQKALDELQEINKE